MAGGIGVYRTRVVRMARATNRDGSFGDPRPIFEDAEEYWASVNEVSAAQQLANSQRDSRSDVEIRIRGVVALSANDRVRIKSTGDVYHLDGVRTGVNETIAVGFRHTG